MKVRVPKGWAPRKRWAAQLEVSTWRMDLALLVSVAVVRGYRMLAGETRAADLAGRIAAFLNRRAGWLVRERVVGMERVQ